MNKLTPYMFVVPVTVLILLLFLFVHQLKKVQNKTAFKHLVSSIFLLAFVCNMIWEMFHMLLYKNNLYNGKHIFICALASIADALMVLLIYFLFALIFKNPLWAKSLTASKIIMLVFIGGIGATISETIHLSVGNWNYAASMPIVPIINVGLSPILQFMLLPAIIYYLSFRLKG